MRIVNKTEKFDLTIEDLTASGNPGEFYKGKDDSVYLIILDRDGRKDVVCLDENCLLKDGDMVFHKMTVNVIELR